MANTRLALVGALTLSLVLISSALLAQVRQETTTTTQTQDGTTTQIHTVTRVIGSSVRLEGGDTYGKIEDIVLNEAGCLEYVVVTYEDQYYVVPWSVTKVNYQERSILLNTTQKDLRQVAFSRNDWRGVSYDQISQKTRQVFRSPAGEIRGRDNRPGERPRGRINPEGRRGPLRKARPDDRIQGRDNPPDGPRTRDLTPDKKSNRPRLKEDSPQPKVESRPEASPDEPKRQPDQP